MDAHELHIQLDPAKRASDDIYEQLRALITSGALKPGDRLPSERAMMAELQRSRPTIREALKRLEQGGYVTSTQGASGAVVQELSLHAAEEPLKDMIQLSQVSLSELNEYRQSNDSTIAAWAAKRRTDEDLADLHQCVAEAEASLNDYERFIELDVRFHSLLARASANQVAIGVVDQLRGGGVILVGAHAVEAPAGVILENLCHLGGGLLHEGDLGIVGIVGVIGAVAPWVKHGLNAGVQRDKGVDLVLV